MPNESKSKTVKPVKTEEKKVVKKVVKATTPKKTAVDYQAKLKALTKKHNLVKKENAELKEEFDKVTAIADKNFQYAEMIGKKNQELTDVINFAKAKETQIVNTVGKVLGMTEDLIEISRKAINHDLAKKMPNIGEQ